MKQYIVNADGTLSEVDSQKIKNFTNKEAVERAIAAGTLQDGELFSTNTHIGIDEDIVDQVHKIELLIPESASAQNILVTINQLMDKIDELDVGQLRSDVDTNITNIATLRTTKVECSDYNTVVPSCATALNKLATMADVEARVDQTVYNSDKSQICSAIQDRVTCDDYSSDIGALSTCDTTLSTTKVECSDYQSYQSDVTTCFGTKVNCSDYNTCVSNLSSTKVTCTDYTTALGTKVTCTDYTTCIASLVARIAALESCPGLKCTGSVNGSLSGTSLTLTGN